jgi:AraC-like DNA-binding protein
LGDIGRDPPRSPIGRRSWHKPATYWRRSSSEGQIIGNTLLVGELCRQGDFPILLERNSEVQIAVQYARGGLPPCVQRRVRDHIAAHLDQKITNDALAQIAGLSTAHFCTVFKQTEGMSPHRYVLQYRVRRAQQLLASTEMSLAEIADAVGFSNPSHCIHYFREIVGVTPGEYRRCCRPRPS